MREIEKIEPSPFHSQNHYISWEKIFFRQAFSFLEGEK